jgi:hypothetical protein
MVGGPGGPGVLRRGWLRLVDGACPWGVIIVCPDRMGVTRYRLVIYPPGINETERRRLRVWRGWPRWGALLWIASSVILAGLIGPRTALGISTAALVGTGVAAFTRAGDVRARVRTLRATVMSGYPDPVSRDALRRLNTLAATLIEADDCRQLGLISPIEYEMTCWRVYDQIQPTTHSHPHRTHWWERAA